MPGILLPASAHVGGAGPWRALSSGDIQGVNSIQTCLGEPVPALGVLCCSGYSLKFSILRPEKRKHSCFHEPASFLRGYNFLFKAIFGVSCFCPFPFVFFFLFFCLHLEKTKNTALPLPTSCSANHGAPKLLARLLLAVAGPRRLESCAGEEGRGAFTD